MPTTKPGVIIGQRIQPNPVVPNPEARLPVAIGRGSRLAQTQNEPLIRAFVYDEELTFPSLAPFTATLLHFGNGDKSVAKLFKSSGEEVRADQYTFDKTGPDYNKVTIRTEVYDPSASYLISYQSLDRDVLDPLPIEDLREIRALSTKLDQTEFVEYEDYFIPMTYSAVDPDAGNANLAPSLQAVQPDGGNTGTGTVAQNAGSVYTHNYNRFYSLVVTAAAGVTPSRTATLTWQAVNETGGNAGLPPVPLHSAESLPTINLVEATPASLTNIALELGITLDFTFGVTHFVLGDAFTFNAKGPGIIELDPRLTNSNQYGDVGAVAVGGTNTGTGSIGFAADNAYSGSKNIGIALKCIAASGSTPTRVATFVWSSYRELGFGNGTFSIAEATPATLTQTLSNGLKITLAFGATNFAVDDVFSFLANAPRLLVNHKDDRTTLLTVTASTVISPTESFVSGTYSINTIEGGFGSFSASMTADGVKDGRFQLPGNVYAILRNAIQGGTNANLNAVDDKYSFSETLSDVVNFSLTQLASDVVQVSQILLDVTGAITGTANTYYALLSKQYLAGTVSTSPLVSFVEISGTPYIKFVTKPTQPLTISYEHKGNEPDPGQTYYLTANYLRPASFFNTLKVVKSLDEGRLLLGPASIDNHLYFANEIAWTLPTKPTQIGYIQAKDADGDGVYTVTDYRAAILASELKKDITDRVVLGNFSSLPDLLNTNLKMSDPYKSNPHLVWIGAPINTPVGDIDTAGSLVQLGKVTLQVFGASPAHGTRILVAPTFATGDVVLQDGSSVTVTVDGSFYAWSLAVKTAGFTDPSDSILSTNESSWFKTIQTHSEEEDLLLIEAGVVFTEDKGSGVYQTGEDITVDNFAPDFKNINAMTQKQAVTKLVRSLMTNSLIGVKASSGQAGVGTIASVLSNILITLKGRGVIAPWQNAAGEERPFDSSTDIRVFRDTSDPTRYAFIYNYFVQYIIKRLDGQFTVNSATLTIE